MRALVYCRSGVSWAIRLNIIWVLLIASLITTSRAGRGLSARSPRSASFLAAKIVAANRIANLRSSVTKRSLAYSSFVRHARIRSVVDNTFRYMLQYLYVLGRVLMIAVKHN